MSSSLHKTVLVIGIDFGTTFSGVTWLCHDEGMLQDSIPSAVQPVSRWPSNSSQNSDSFKVPTKIAYDPLTGEPFWGFDVPEELEAQAIKWFKLLLIDEDDLELRFRDSDNIKHARKLVSRLRKDPVEVIAKYLELLWHHSITRIEREKGKSRVAAMPFHVVMTVPAMWKDYARDRMRRAAKMAHILDERLCGETKLSFISEPEAATLTVLPELPDLEKGDSFVLCDCGGGTVDIISYIVDQLDPLIIHEAVEGEGGLCGATFLDQDFIKYMKDAIGLQRWTTLRPGHARKVLTRDWEHEIKRDFDGNPNRTFSINLVSINDEDATQLDANTLRRIFRPTVESIDMLVDNQIQAIMAKTRTPPKFIALVGGFGRAAYLYTYLQEREEMRVVQRRYSRPIEIHQQSGDKSWSAVCRGATLFGATGRGSVDNPGRSGVAQIRSRVSRLSYGWTFRTPFVEGVHDPRDKEWDDIDKEWMAENQMQWIVKRGETVEGNGGKIYSYYQRVSAMDNGQPLTHKIYTSPNSQPGSRLVPLYREFDKITYTLPVPVSRLPKMPGISDQYRRFDIEYRIEVNGASMDMSVWHKNTKIGGKNVNVSLD